jgi:hypothetical protein
VLIRSDSESASRVAFGRTVISILRPELDAECRSLGTIGACHQPSAGKLVLGAGLEMLQRFFEPCTAHQYINENH